MPEIRCQSLTTSATTAVVVGVAIGVGHLGVRRESMTGGGADLPYYRWRITSVTYHGPILSTEPLHTDPTQRVMATADSA